MQAAGLSHQRNLSRFGRGRGLSRGRGHDMNEGGHLLGPHRRTLADASSWGPGQPSALPSDGLRVALAALSAGFGVPPSAALFPSLWSFPAAAGHTIRVRRLGGNDRGGVGLGSIPSPAQEIECPLFPSSSVASNDRGNGAAAHKL
jgi:hypothetical protein